jgi:hypothetical protein
VVNATDLRIIASLPELLPWVATVASSRGRRSEPTMAGMDPEMTAQTLDQLDFAGLKEGAFAGRGRRALPS